MVMSRLIVGIFAFASNLKTLLGAAVGFLPPAFALISHIGLGLENYD